MPRKIDFILLPLLRPTCAVSVVLFSAACSTPAPQPPPLLQQTRPTLSVRTIVTPTTHFASTIEPQHVMVLGLPNRDVAWRSVGRERPPRPGAVEAPVAPPTPPIAPTLVPPSSVAPDPGPDVVVRFASGQAELTEHARTTLDDFVPLASHEAWPVLLVGQSDAIAADAYNAQLSEARAKVVRAYLIAHGIAPRRITTAGKGASEPEADNATSEGRVHNRRALIIMETAE